MFSLYALDTFQLLLIINDICSLWGDGYGKKIQKPYKDTQTISNFFIKYLNKLSVILAFKNDIFLELHL